MSISEYNKLVEVAKYELMQIKCSCPSTSLACDIWLKVKNYSSWHNRRLGESKTVVRFVPALLEAKLQAFKVGQIFVTALASGELY
jgi:hypothetical protein